MERKSGDAARGFFVVRLIETLVVVENGQDVVLTRDDGAGREGEQLVDVVQAGLNRADELVVDPDGGSEIYSGVRSAGTAELSDLQVPP